MERQLLDVEEYLAEILSLASPITERETVGLDAALDRVLAQPVHARGPIPAFDNSSMDGFAIRHADLAAHPELVIAGEVPAGSSQDPGFGPGQCVRIMTGAPMPSSADTIVPIEVTSVDGDRIRIRGSVTEGQFVRAAGSDVSRGTRLLEAGERLNARKISVVAAAGHEHVEVMRRLVVGVVATGDELVAPGGDLQRGQIFDSNSAFLAAAVGRMGARPVVRSRVPDHNAALEGVLDELSSRCDVILVTGGVSVGDHDVTRMVLEERGAVFRHVRMQPGKPQGWTRWDGVPVIGLPGNPLSVTISFEVFVVSLLDALLGTATAPWTGAVAADEWSSPEGRRQFVPARIEVTREGTLLVRRAHQGGSASHLVTSLAQADGLAVVPEETTRVSEGDPLNFRRLT